MWQILLLLIPVFVLVAFVAWTVWKVDNQPKSLSPPPRDHVDIERERAYRARMVRRAEAKRRAIELLHTAGERAAAKSLLEHFRSEGFAESDMSIVLCQMALFGQEFVTEKWINGFG